MGLGRSQRAGDPGQPPDRTRADAAEQVVDEVLVVDTEAAKTEVPFPEFRQRVRELAESQWHEPVSLVHVRNVKPEFHVPGRRRDGTIKGKRLIRRFFWNICRGIIFVVLNIIGGFFAGELSGRPHFDESDSKVTGPENAQALELVDAVRRVKGLWLVYSSSHVAMIDSGDTSVDPADSPPPKFLWHAAKPHAPELFPLNQSLKWPDGSKFRYVISKEERALIKRERGR